VLARKSKRVKSQILDKPRLLPVEEAFSRRGYYAAHTNDKRKALKILGRATPYVMLVDWLFSSRIQHDILSVSLGKAGGARHTVIFYNVPGVIAPEVDREHHHVHYIGEDFTDKDMLKRLPASDKAVIKETAQSMSVETHALEGDLGPEVLSDFLQYLDASHKSGRLLIYRDGLYGMMCFLDGQIVFASAVDAAQKEAVFKILSMREGKFQFTAGNAITERNMSLSVMEGLMEWAKERDEVPRFRASNVRSE
jgi:hypothetical protein